MKIVKGYPPNYKDILAAFNPAKTYLFTYGDTIYFPMLDEQGRIVREDIIRHEEVHERQQSRFLMNPAKWWKKYIDKADFRLQQEIEAYREQWLFVDTHASRHDKRAILNAMAQDLSSKNYGNLMSYNDAIMAITS